MKRESHEEIELAVREYKEGRDQETNSTIIFNHYSPRIYNYLRNKGERPAIAEDLAQETLINFTSSIWRFRFDCSIDTYVFRIACNQWRKHRRRAVTSFVSLDDGTLEADRIAELEAAEPVPEDELLAEERYGRVRELIRGLPPRQRECVELHYYQGRSLREISEITGTKVSSVGANLFFGREKLKKALREDVYPPGEDRHELGERRAGSSREDESCSRQMEISRI